MIKLKDTLLPLRATLEAAISKAADRGRTYLVENPSEDNFDELLKQSGCVDRTNFAGRWKRRRFDHGAGYSGFRHYEFYPVTRRSITTRALLGKMGFRFFTSHTTVRELLSCLIHHRSTIESMLRKGKVIVALGKDDLNFYRDTVTVIFLEKGVVVLDEAPFSGHWTDKHVVLSRVRRSS